MMLDSLFNLEFIGNQYMYDYVQVRKPRSKKKRIQKKWRKNPANYQMVPWTTMYQFGQQIIAHPQKIQELRQSLDSDRELRELAGRVHEERQTAAFTKPVTTEEILKLATDLSQSMLNVQENADRYRIRHYSYDVPFVPKGIIKGMSE